MTFFPYLRNGLVRGQTCRTYVKNQTLIKRDEYSTLGNFVLFHWCWSCCSYLQQYFCSFEKKLGRDQTLALHQRRVCSLAENSNRFRSVMLKNSRPLLRSLTPWATNLIQNYICITFSVYDMASYDEMSNAKNRR